MESLSLNRLPSNPVLRYCNGLLLVTLLTLSFSSQALEPPESRDVFLKIAQFATEYCNKIPLDSSTSQARLSSDANGKLRGLAKFFAGLGFSAAAKYISTESSGIPQQQLVPALKDNYECRAKVLDFAKTNFIGREFNAQNTCSLLNIRSPYSVAESSELLYCERNDTVSLSGMLQADINEVRVMPLPEQNILSRIVPRLWPKVSHHWSIACQKGVCNAEIDKCGWVKIYPFDGGWFALDNLSYPVPIEAPTPQFQAECGQAPR